MDDAVRVERVQGKSNELLGNTLKVQQRTLEAALGTLQKTELAVKRLRIKARELNKGPTQSMKVAMQRELVKRRQADRAVKASQANISRTHGMMNMVTKLGDAHTTAQLQKDLQKNFKKLKLDPERLEKLMETGGDINDSIEEVASIADQFTGGDNVDAEVEEEMESIWNMDGDDELSTNEEVNYDLSKTMPDGPLEDLEEEENGTGMSHLGKRGLVKNPSIKEQVHIGQGYRQLSHAEQLLNQTTNLEDVNLKVLVNTE
ncbi:MAG: hypothetical protein JKY23_00435 [Nitrospinaceae bacterium]|nr:hypothetical protein [Nitrospinaceae bacterium]